MWMDIVLGFVALAFGVLSIWAAGEMEKDKQKLTDSLDEQAAAAAAKDKENAIIQAGLAARASSGDAKSDELSTHPLPVSDYRD